MQSRRLMNLSESTKPAAMLPRVRIMVRSRRLELPRALAHSDLNAARLPLPPRPLRRWPEIPNHNHARKDRPVGPLRIAKRFARAAAAVRSVPVLPHDLPAPSGAGRPPKRRRRTKLQNLRSLDPYLLPRPRIAALARLAPDDRERAEVADAVTTLPLRLPQTRLDLPSTKSTVRLAAALLMPPFRATFSISTVLLMSTSSRPVPSLNTTLRNDPAPVND